METRHDCSSQNLVARKGSSMLAFLVRARVALIAPFRTLPWIGWVAWYVFVAVAITRIHPRRFSSTFTAYLDAAERLSAGEHVYNPLIPGDFLYFPISL